MIQWAWNYITLGRGARLITETSSLELELEPPQYPLNSTKKTKDSLQKPVSA